jgi:hypothetical protein
VDTSIIIIIFGLLVASVVGSIIFTKKEQAASLRRQQVANFRYRADQAQELYDGLQTAGLEKITYQFLLQRIIANLEEAYKIDPRSPGIKVRLNSAKEALSNLENVEFHVQMPSAMTELHGLVGRLNKLFKYLILLFQKGAMPENQYSQIMPVIQRTLLKFDAEGHIKMGHQAANDGQPGTAKQCYLHAKEKLLDFGTEDSYISAQLEKVDGLISSLEKQPTSDSTADVQTADVEQAPDVANEIAANEDKTDAQIAQEKINQESEDRVDFTSKKKW